jgi:hypothetical protein
MDGARAIAINQTALTRNVAELVVMAGLTTDSSVDTTRLGRRLMAISRLSRPYHSKPSAWRAGKRSARRWQIPNSRHHCVQAGHRGTARKKHMKSMRC